MKNLWQTFIAIGLLLAIMQGPDLGEAKKIKKIVKELKKLKKYAYLLAGQRKKLYAIPFPMPLPVFVKRQHIYTQVPIIPRYVQHPQHPQHYGTPSISSDSSAASYDYTPSDSLYSNSESPYPSEMLASYSPTKSYSSSSGYGSSRKHKHSSNSRQPQQQQQLDQQQQWLGLSAKYLSQLANMLGQSNTMLGSGASKEIISKLVSGQARVLPPSALLSAIKSPSVVPGALMGAHKPKGYYEQGQKEDPNQDQRDTKSSTSSSSGSQSSSYNPVSFDDSAPTTTNSTKGSDSSSDNKAAPSDIYRTALGFRPNSMRHTSYNPYTSPYRLNPMISPIMSPLAALAMAGRPASLQAGGNFLRGPLSGNLLPLMDSLAGLNQNDQQDDPQEASSNQQENESAMTGRDYSRAYQNLLRQRQLQLLQQQQQRQQQQLQIHPDPLLVSATAQRMHRQQEALKMALLREQEVAARLAESRQILVRANQLGLPIVPGGDQASLLKYYTRQPQMVMS